MYSEAGAGFGKPRCGRARCTADCQARLLAKFSKYEYTEQREAGSIEVGLSLLGKTEAERRNVTSR